GQAASATPPAGGPTHRLFRNDAGHFVDVTQDSGLAVRDFGLGVAVGDIDNDGRLDLYLSNYGKNRLFRNLGGLRFEDITDQAGVGDTGFAGGAVFGDPDRDGDLDLYVCNYLDFRWDGDTSEESAAGGYSLPFTLNPSSYDPQANRYFRNLGDGRFEEVSQALGIDDPQGKSLSATFVDFNEDGWPDLYVLNDVSKNSYFENRGDGSFEDRSLSSLSADYRGAMGNAIGDMDADGDLDLFITHWIAQENGVFANRWRDRDPAEVPTDRGLYFADMAEMVGLGAASLNFVGWGTAYCDFDLNGVLDLVVVNGSTMPSNQDPSQLVAQRPQLFWQKEGWGFYEMGSAAGSCWSQVWNARGLAEGDLDGDGDLDFVVTTNYGPVKILRNEGPTGHWFGLRLRQPEINRFAVGARITLTAGGRRQVAEVGAGTSYLCHRPLTLTFGLGTAMHIEKLEVNWPDGAVTTLTDLDVDQTLTLGPDAGK
ncbi:MAG: CRTAC1 family protein, partial [Planctomycetes bacterium]|nr:CRTAC1 family protein [Planctomycetota bacterium]